MSAEPRPPDGAPARAAVASAASVLAALLSRHSVPAQRLTTPGPTPEQLDAALQAALRAPDHGALRPWRFVVIRGAARETYAALLERRMRERVPDIAQGKIDKQVGRVRAAPVLIAVGAHVRAGHKVPELEQLLSTGAAVMNLLNALHAQGFGAIWLTGDNAYDERIAADLGFASSERCLGFVFAGTPDTQDPLPPPRRPELAGIVREWTGS